MPTEQKSQQIEDRLLIMEALGRYAAAYDESDLDQLDALLLEDGLEQGERAGEVLWSMSGKAAVIDGLKGARAQQPPPSRHVLSNFMFDELAEDKATVRYYFTLLSKPDGSPIIHGFGSYKVALMKSGGNWRVKSKIAYLD